MYIGLKNNRNYWNMSKRNGGHWRD